MNQSIRFRGIEIIRLFEIIDNRSFVSRKARYLSLVETGDNFYFLLDNIVNFLHEFSLDSHSLMIKYFQLQCQFYFTFSRSKSETNEIFPY